MGRLKKGERLSSLTFGQARVRGFTRKQHQRAINIKQGLQRRRIALRQQLKQERYSVALNFPMHEQYWGVLGQIWRKKVTDDDIKFIVQRTQEALLSFLGYSEDELSGWIDLEEVTQGEGIQEAPEPQAEGYWEIRIENPTGATEFQQQGVK